MDASLQHKLDTFDRQIDEAIDELELLLRYDRPMLKAIARGRHVTGHVMYGDGELYEYDEGRLRLEAVKELADAAIYTLVLRARTG